MGSGHLQLCRCPNRDLEMVDKELWETIALARNVSVGIPASIYLATAKKQRQSLVSENLPLPPVNVTGTLSRLRRCISVTSKSHGEVRNSQTRRHPEIETSGNERLRTLSQAALLNSNLVAPSSQGGSSNSKGCAQ